MEQTVTTQTTNSNRGKVRTATLEDREALRRVINDAFGVERRIKKGGRDRLAEDSGELDELLARGTFLVVENEGKFVACVYLEGRGERCYLGLLSVTPAAQGQGLGRVMMEAAESLAREWGCRWIDLRVVSARREGLVPLYDRLGFHEAGTQPYPDALAEVMVEPGHFILMEKQLPAL
jgi:GNAT superfamily N-acetyltransferase